MKKIIMMLFLFASVGFYANAQNKKPAASKLPKPLVAKLNLTSDQQTKIDAILGTKATKIDSLSAVTPAMDAKSLRKNKKSLNDEAITKIENVLTDDQKKIYADFRTEQQAKAKAKKGGMEPATTPPAAPPVQ
ncbi:MAG: hypothetical protein V4592_26305 [Bacteroidota bacterium]